MPSPNYAAYTRLANGQAISLGRARPQWEGPVTAYPNLDVSSLPEGSTRILCFNPLTFMTFGDMDYEEPDLGLKLARWDTKTLQSRKIFIFDVEGYALRCAQSLWHPERDAILKTYSIARVLKTSAEYETAHAQAEILYYIISKVGDKLDELAHTGLPVRDVERRTAISLAVKRGLQDQVDFFRRPLRPYSWENTPAHDLRESQMFGRMHDICNERGSPIPDLPGWLVLLPVHDWTGNQLRASNILLRIGSGARGSGNLRAVFTQDNAPRSETRRSTRSFTLLDHVLDGHDDHVDHPPEEEQFLNLPDSPDRDVEILLLDEGGPRPPNPEPLTEAATVPARYADPNAQDSDDVGDVDYLTGTDPTLVDNEEEEEVQQALYDEPNPQGFRYAQAPHPSGFRYAQPSTPPTTEAVITTADGTRYDLVFNTDTGFLSDVHFDYYDTFDVRLSD